MKVAAAKGLLVGLLALLATGCGGPAVLASTELSSSGGWVIVVYMNADNELEAQAIADINEMEAAGLRGSGVTVVVLLDRAVGNDASNGDWTGTRLYEIADDPEGVDDVIRSVELAVPSLGLEVGSADAELNTGDPRALGAVLDLVEDRYRPDRTAVIVWGYGDGFGSTGYDESSGGDVLHAAELSLALAGRELDLVGFDTDSAATIEVAWELRGTAELMVASQDSQPPDGWEYDRFLRRFMATDRSSRSLAMSVGETFASTYTGMANATLSVIRLDRVAGVMDALNGLADQLSAAIESPASRDPIREALFYDAEDFYSTPGDLAIDLGDLGTIVERDFDVADDEADALSASVADAVLWSTSGAANPRATGLGVHLVPLRDDGTAETSHDARYVRGSSVSHPLSFVAASTWVPRLPDGPGLLHRLFYQ